VFLFTNKIFDKEIKKTILFTKETEQTTLIIDLTKKVKYLYTENHNTLMKKIEKDTNKWKDILCLWI
jgi:hypothetical protein